MADQEIVYTVGHSNHAPEVFVSLLKGVGIEAIADVRSTPYSRHNPHYNRETLAATLKENGLAYVWLGDGLGARPADASLRRRDGGVDFHRLAASEAFRRGIERVCRGARRFKVAMMCAERDPLACHRTFLISRHLSSKVAEIRHILGDGRVIHHRDLEEDLIRRAFPKGYDLFMNDESALLSEAYDRVTQGLITKL